MDKFVRHGLSLPWQSLCNIPILPVIEPNEDYRMVQDLRVVNDTVVSIPPLVANPYNILTQIPEDAKWFTVLSLKDGFFCNPVHSSWKFAAMSCEQRWDSWPPEERNLIWGQWRGLITQCFCVIVLLKYKRDRESFWHGHQKGAERVPPC